MKKAVVCVAVMVGCVIGLPTARYHLTKENITARVVKVYESGDQAKSQIVHLDTNEIVVNKNVALGLTNPDELRTKIIEGHVCNLSVALIGDPRDPRRVIYEADCTNSQPPAAVAAAISKRVEAEISDAKASGRLDGLKQYGD